MKIIHFYKLISIFIGILLYSDNVFSVSILREVKKNENNFEIIFDKQINPRDIKIEYLRDIIQLSVSKANVYPAKISSYENNEIKKIFAYQYSPQLIRIRFTVNGEAEKFRNKFIYKIDKNKIVAHVKEVVPQLKETQEVKKESHVSIADDKIKLNDDIQKSPLLTQEQNNELGLKDQFIKVMLRLGGVVFFLLFFAIVYKKYISKKKIKRNVKKENAFQSIFGGLFAQKFKMGNSFMEIIATHHLGPKKSILVVKIKDETLVLGISDESINLITKLKTSDEATESVGTGDFTDLLVKEMEFTADKKPIVNNKSHSMISDDIRNRIRKKIGIQNSL